MKPPRKVLFLGDLEDAEGETIMRFRLIYDGVLRPTGNRTKGRQTEKLAAHKQSIRREFHKQLRQLWSVNKFLSEHMVFGADYGMDRAMADNEARWSSYHSSKVTLLDAVASQHRKFGYKFVPLVRKNWSVLCSLDILFLRRDPPGSVIQAGDIDNRIKTLIDALRCPQNQSELVNDDTNPGSDDSPFFCLLEDDNLIDRFTVETDTLLDPVTDEDTNKQKVRVIITAELRPYYVTMFNLSLA